MELQEIAQAAAALGATVCTATVRPYSDDLPYHENFELHRRRFGGNRRTVGPPRHQAGTGVSGGRRASGGPRHPFIHQAETLLTLIKTVGSPHVGLTLDTWSWFVGGGTLDQLRQIPPQQIVAARFADIRRRGDLGQITDEDRYLPGDGGAVDCAPPSCGTWQNTISRAPSRFIRTPPRFRGMTRDAIVQQASARFDALYRAAGISRSGKLETLPSPSLIHS